MLKKNSINTGHCNKRTDEEIKNKEILTHYIINAYKYFNIFS
jgi:hypothetical protein